MDINTFTKHNLMEKYSSGKSMSEIAKEFKCSQNRVVYWMKKYGIKRRSHSDAAYLKQNPDGDPFNIKTNLSKHDSFLYGLGLGIYWGEGNKNPTIPSLRVANTDPDLIRTFLFFLKSIYRLDAKRFSYSIVCFNDTNPEVARSYWAKQLKISPSKFGKITQIPSQGKGTYKKKSRYGVCIVQGNNSKLRKLVITQIENIKKNMPR